jgi:hypothetical protein
MNEEEMVEEWKSLAKRIDDFLSNLEPESRKDFAIHLSLKPIIYVADSMREGIALLKIAISRYRIFMKRELKKMDDRK